jgi:hypothetical protein
MAAEQGTSHSPVEEIRGPEDIVSFRAIKRIFPLPPGKHIEMAYIHVPGLTIATSYSGGRIKPVPSPEFETTQEDRERVAREFDQQHAYWKTTHPDDVNRIEGWGRKI